MIAYTANALEVEVIPSDKIPPAVREFSNPAMVGRLTRYTRTNIYQWQIQIHEDWIPWGPPIQLLSHAKKSYCADCLASYGKFVVHEPRERCPARAR